MSKRDKRVHDKRHLYFRDRKFYREMQAKQPKIDPIKVQEAIGKLKIGDTVTFDPPTWTITATASALDTDLDWRTDNLDTLMEAAMAGDSLPTRTAQSYLAEMMEVVETRGKTHGSKAQSFAVIAEFRSLYLRSRIWAEPGEPESAVDEGIGMALHKIGRFCQGEQSEEHLKDAIGYLACSLEILAANATPTRR